MIIRVWGRNNYGQLDMPPEAFGDDFAEVAAGWYHTLARKSDGSLIAWGWNDFGQIDLPIPNENFIKISTEFAHNAALTTSGTVVCWGRDDYGQVSDAPVGTGFVDVSAGNRHCLALTSSGTIVAWGIDAFNQVSHTPTGSNFTQVWAGSFSSFALTSEGYIETWGRGDLNQLEVPSPNENFVAVRYCAGLKSDGTVVLWGPKPDYPGASEDDKYPEIPMVVATAPNNFREIMTSIFGWSIALTNNNVIVVWGRNEYNQCEPPAPLTGWKCVSAGVYHGVGLKEVATESCYGEFFLRCSKIREKR